jgi:hypothetical protein
MNGSWLDVVGLCVVRIFQLWRPMWEDIVLAGQKARKKLERL